MIPPLQQAIRVAEAGGAIGREFKRWLDLIAQSVASTRIGDSAPGRSLAVGDGQFAIHAEELVLNGTEEASLEGDSILVVI